VQDSLRGQFVFVISRLSQRILNIAGREVKLGESFPLVDGEEAEAEASKGKSKKRRTTKAIIREIEEEEEEDIEDDISESESDCIIVASSRSTFR